MSRLAPIGSAAALTTLLGTTSVFADVTAMDVWEDWRDYMVSMGYTVNSGNMDESGGTLTVTDMTARLPLAEAQGLLELAMPELVFEERGDGKVAVALPDAYTVSINGEGGEDGESFDMELTVSQTGMTVLASGDDTETAYNFAATDMTIEATRFMVDNAPLDADIVANLTGYTGNYVMTEGALTDVTGTARADGFDLAFSVNEPEKDMVVDMTMSAKDMAGDISMSLPDEFDQENMAANIDAGFAAKGSYAFGASTVSLDGRGEDGETFDLATTMDAAEVDFQMDKDGLGLSELVEGMDITISGSEIPLPEVIVSAAEYGLNFLMPITKSDEPDDFELGLRLVDLDVQDQLWAMLDPAGALPHEPATLIVDTVGKANWFVSIMDPEVQENLESSGETPGALHALTLRDLKLSLAGTELTGKGDFTFDNSDLETFNGMPRPEGQVDLKLVGANTLLDKLVEMGMVPEDQAMGARMMMGLFAVPGQGEDTLTSTIEINEQGQVLANGQRLK